jgi:ribosomal protein S18 acetylase RimI-like enzyme
MIQRLDFTNPATLTAAFQLQKDAYEQEARLIGSRMIPPLLETIEGLRDSNERFYGEIHDGLIVGIIALCEEGPYLRISRLAVAPTHFGKGIGTRLIRFANDSNEKGQSIVVSTGEANTPARNLYEKLGFRLTRVFPAGEVMLAEYLRD